MESFRLDEIRSRRECSVLGRRRMERSPRSTGVGSNARRGRRAQPGELALGELARGGDAALAQRVCVDLAVEELPRLAIADAAHRRHRRRQRVRSRSARSSSTSPAASIASNRRAMASCSRARSGGISAIGDRRHRATSRLAPPCSADIGWPVNAIDLERALDALRVGRRQPRRGRGIDARELGVQRRPAVARGARVDLGAHGGVGARQRDSPSVSALKYSIVPPASIGRRPRARMSLRSPPARRRRNAPPNTPRSDRRCRSGDAARARVRPPTASRCRCPCRGTPAPSRR